MRSTHVVGPTAHERVDHDRLHLLHRSWYSVRVAGRGTSLGHKIALDELEQHAFEVSFDCSFPSRSARGDYLQVLLACDRAWRSIIVHSVPSKGANVSWTAEQVCRDLKPLGRHGRVTVRSAKKLGWQVFGFLQEVATVRELWALSWNTLWLVNRRQTVELIKLRVLLRRRESARRSLRNTVFSFLLIGFVTTGINRHLVGKDGRAAYERTKHNLHRSEVLPFVCQATLRFSGKSCRCVMVERCFMGVRLGAGAHGRTIGCTKLSTVLLHGHGS